MPLVSNSLSPVLLIMSQIFLTSFLCAEATCRTSCGNLPIHYPFGIDDGCGSLYYRHLFYCTNSDKLELRTPTGTYPVSAISYSDPYILISDPDMWTCQDGQNFRSTRPFILDPKTHLSVSPLNDFLFFNCSEQNVMIAPKPVFCGRFPDRCDASCDSASYLCTHLPGCETALGESSCCSYSPKAMDSLKMMVKYCGSYTSVYWRSVGDGDNKDQIAEYGIRIDFDFLVTTTCLGCQDVLKGGGSCGFDVETLQFLCICDDNKNVTTYCQDQSISSVSNKHRIIAGTVSAVSAAGALGIAATILFMKKLKKANAPVTCGVQTNDNRLF